MNDYPNLWKRGLIQERVRERANHCCEQCGMEFHEGTNIAKEAIRRDGLPYVGTCHHIDYDKSNNRMENLVYLCQSCHYIIHMIGWKPGRPLPKRWRNQHPQWAVDRGLIKQMTLFEDV